MSETSVLTEVVAPELLVETEVFTVQIMDQDKITHKYELTTNIDNPYDFNAERFLPNTTPMSLTRFFSIASGLIGDAQARARIDTSKRVRLIEEYPPEPFDRYGDEIIAYRVLKREPARMSVKGTSRPHRKSTWYYDTVSPEHPNKTIIIESRPVDHHIEFSCWAKSNKLANSRALWLEKLFINHAWAFEVQGVERFFWKDRGPDTYTTSGGQRLFYRPVNFFVRFREFEVKAHPTLRTINFEVSENTTLSTDLVSSISNNYE
jgi:hypothetical protein